MKCAVAIVLALIGMTIANPVPPLGISSLVTPHVLPAVSVSSSVIIHGLTLPHVSIPVVKSIVHVPVTWWDHGLG